MTRASVTGYARLHFGFCNLSLARERLYGSVGVGLDRPSIRVTATPAAAVRCAHPTVREYAARSVDLLDVSGADLTVESEFPRHVGLGSGTQFALATLVAVARAHDETVDPREAAPELGRGGRSGIGVATFDDGGFVLDAGHPTTRFTTDRPALGRWSVPPVAARHPIPDDWRFLVVGPDASSGPSGDDEECSMRSAGGWGSPSQGGRPGGGGAERVGEGGRGGEGRNGRASSDLRGAGCRATAGRVTSVRRLSFLSRPAGSRVGIRAAGQR